MGVGINLGTPWHLFPSGVREKGSGVTGCCGNPAISHIFYSCGLGPLWLQTGAQLVVLHSNTNPCAPEHFRLAWVLVVCVEGG